MKRRGILFEQCVLALDLLVLIGSYLLAYWLRDLELFRSILEGPVRKVLPFARYSWVLWVIVPIWFFSLRWFGLYKSARYDSPKAIIKSVFQVQLLAGLALLSTMYLMKRTEVSRLLLQGFVGVSFVLLMAEKLMVRKALALLASRSGAQHSRKVLVVGENSLAEGYFRLLGDHPHWAVKVVGLLSLDSIAAGNGAGQHQMDEPEHWDNVLRQYVVDEVVAACHWQDAAGMEGLARACVERGITFRTLVQMPPTAVGSYYVEDFGRGSFLVSVETVPQSTATLLVKRLMDIAGSIVGLVLCGLTYLWYGPRIRRESPGPVFFSQQRVGQNGRRFTIYKFRTMHMDAEQRIAELMARNEMKGHIFKLKDDPRVTPLGKVLRRRHIDELPQFWNVLKSEMSLVGTRPPTPNEVARYSPHQHRRLSMKPGITGPWQLNGNGTVNDFDEVVKLDCEYIDNWSLWLDCRIVAKTLLKVARAEGW